MEISQFVAGLEQLQRLVHFLGVDPDLGTFYVAEVGARSQKQLSAQVVCQMADGLSFVEEKDEGFHSWAFTRQSLVKSESKRESLVSRNALVTLRR